MNLTYSKSTPNGLGPQLLLVRLINFSGAPEYTVKCPGRSNFQKEFIHLTPMKNRAAEKTSIRSL